MASFKEGDNKNLVNTVYVDGPIIVGAGPSGLAVAACLQKNGVPSLVLERSDCLASLWQHKTYDRLKLHLPKEFCQLPFLDFPEYFPKYPTKHQFISYMEAYAQHFSIEPKFNQSVVRASFDLVSLLWRVETEYFQYMSRWLVVATGENADPFMPEIPGVDKFRGPVLHTSDYKSGLEFQKQKVLVVGCGNSGMEVSLDLYRHNAYPHMVVRNSVHVLPREMFGVSTFSLAMMLLKWLPLKLVDMFLLLVANCTVGNTEEFGIRRPKSGPLELKNATGKSPVLDVGALSLIKAGKIEVVTGVKEITTKGAKFIDGQEREYDSILMATGYKSNVPNWLEGTDFFTEDGMPKVTFPNGWKGENGLYAVGFTRRGLLGTSCDAVKIADDIAGDWSMIMNFPEKEIIMETEIISECCEN